MVLAKLGRLFDSGKNTGGRRRAAKRPGPKLHHGDGWGPGLAMADWMPCGCPRRSRPPRLRSARFALTVTMGPPPQRRSVATRI